jgi:hypothetical protein
MATQIKIEPGLQFRSVIADSNSLFQVVAREGRAWLCEVQPEPEPFEHNGVKFYGDYVGEQKVFTAQEIRQRVAFASVFAERAAKDEQAREKLLVAGATVHYHNGIGQFYRCEVVDDGGELKLKPVAIVGRWREYATRGNIMDNGEISYPHEARKVMDGELFVGRGDSSYESETYSEPAHKENRVDPTGLPAIEIVTPEITDGDREFAAVYNAIEQATEALTGKDVRDQPKSARADRAREILAAIGG